MRFDGLLRASCAVVVVLFGCWTILANAVVLSGHSFADLRQWTLFALMGAGVLLGFLRLDGALATVDPAMGDSDPDGARDEPGVSGGTLLRLTIGAGLAAVFAFGKQYLLFWGLTTLYLGFEYWRGRKAPSLRFRVASGRGLNYWLFAASAALAVLAALLLNRPSEDQSLYLNMAVSVLDNPTAPIYATDTLHEIPGAVILPTYRVHSFELLGALVAQELRMAEPIGVFHLLFPPLLTVFVVCAGAVFFRRFLPRRWGWATLALVVVLLVLRGTLRMYGNFAFVRIFEGKSVLVTAMIPLIIVYATDFVVQPRPGRWTLLFLAMVGAVGLTANGLYAAPIAAALGLGAWWRPSWSATRRLALGLLACIYPILMGLFIRSTVVGNGLSLQAYQDFLPMEAAAGMVLGQGATLWVWLLSLTCAWCVIEDRAIRQWVLAFSLGFLMTCMNPFLDEFLGRYVTGDFLTWRLLWAIPLPAFLSLLLIEGIARPGPHRRFVLAFMVAALVIPLALDKPWNDPLLEPGLRIGLKVPQPEYEVARRLGEIGGAGNPVLAPESVSEWVPTFRGHADPVVARELYTVVLLTAYSGRVDTQDLRERLALAGYINGTSSDDQAAEILLRGWVEKGKIAAIAVPQTHRRVDEISEILDEARFDRSEYLGYFIFHR